MDSVTNASQQSFLDSHVHPAIQKLKGIENSTLVKVASVALMIISLIVTNFKLILFFTGIALFFSAEQIAPKQKVHTPPKSDQTPAPQQIRSPQPMPAPKNSIEIKQEALAISKAFVKEKTGSDDPELHEKFQAVFDEAIASLTAREEGDTGLRARDAAFGMRCAFNGTDP